LKPNTGKLPLKSVSYWILFVHGGFEFTNVSLVKVNGVVAGCCPSTSLMYNILTRTQPQSAASLASIEKENFAGDVHSCAVSHRNKVSLAKSLCYNAYVGTTMWVTTSTFLKIEYQ